MGSLDLAHPTLLTFFLIYLAGVVTSLTPCVYPLIPIVIGYLGNRTGPWTHRFWAAIFYVLGLSLVYSALGIVAAASGKVFGQMTTNLYVYLIFGILILVLAGSLMDWYVIPTPGFLQPKSQHHSKKHSLSHAFLVGASSGFIASPCTAPVLGTLLFFIASQKAFVSGSLMMFTFSLGMNSLLLALGFSAGLLHHLPRSGHWMVIVKKALAMLLLASGLYFIFRAGQLS